MRGETDDMWSVLCGDSLAGKPLVYDWAETKAEALELETEANRECPCGNDAHEVQEPKNVRQGGPRGVPGERKCKRCGGVPEGGPPGHNVRTCRLAVPRSPTLGT